VTDPTSERPTIAAAVIVKDGLVLMVRRRVAEGNLSWQFPAGEVEPGESEEDAAVREAEEETGITVRAAIRLGDRVHPATGRRMVYVACDAITGSARLADPEDLAQVEWCDRARLTKYVPFPFYEPVQDYFDSHLK
jgi:8-oxo-dGTP diphosphatase